MAGVGLKLHVRLFVQVDLPRYNDVDDIDMRGRSCVSTRLAQLKIEEVSGVDEPANEVPGWLLAKSKDLEGVIKEVEDAHNGLLTALTSADQYLEDAPEDVKTAADLLKSHVNSLADSDEDRPNFIGRAMSYFKRKEDIEMTKDELLEALAANTTDTTEAIAEAVGKAVAAAMPAPVVAEVVETGETEVVEPVATVALEDFAKLAERVESIADAVEKSAAAIHTILEKSAKRAAIEGQEDQRLQKAKDTEDKMSPLSKAFAAAFKGERVDLT